MQISISNKNPVKEFQWRDRRGEFHDVSQMASRHLFYTLKMIWNHSAPEEFKIEPYKRYYFSPFYTQEYIEQAVRAMISELTRRKNIELYLYDLNFMVDAIKTLQTKGKKCYLPMITS